jgi:DNA polymerase-3 subunit chi
VASSDTKTEVLFYHLERRGLADVLPPLVEKTVERGWRAVVQAVTPAAVKDLDTLLWTYRDDSFLPHGTAADGHASAQPVYLTDTDDNPNGATVRFLVDGATIADASAYARIVHLFDGRNPDAVAAARAEWKAAKAAGYTLTYWQQDDTGRWQKKG